MTEIATGEAPPPYNRDDHAGLNEFVQRMYATMSNTRTHGSILGTEGDRLPNFLLYTLAVDYQRNTHHARDSRAYFWHYIHDPCKELGIPAEYAVLAIQRYFKFTDFAGHYKGSTFGILHTYGLDALAEKLHVDPLVIVPCLIPIHNVDSRDKMIRGIGEVTILFFDLITGTHGSNGPRCCHDCKTSGGKVVERITYVPNERGLAYEARRRDAMASARRDSMLPAAHWALKIKACTQSILRRRPLFARREMSNGGGTWKGPEDPPKGTPNKSHLWKRPGFWFPRVTTFLPELFEHDPNKHSNAF
ncbi:hypothetical protein LTR85_005310 [Meristemomyces frigidus]|nr:hypothetical protein LTR85_005310 [Meristemomyces frigidus]